MKCIVAIDKYKGIGLEGSLPWHCKEDLKHFKEMTMGQNLLMGRKTFESLPTKLKGRTIYVLTKNPSLYQNTKNVVFVRSAPEGKDLIIAGGAAIYDNFYESIDEIYLTFIIGDYQTDTHFNSLRYHDFEWHVLRQTKNAIFLKGKRILPGR